MDEEKTRILQMLRDGKISVDEALKLLEALEPPRPSEEVPQTRPKWLRVRVTEANKEKPKVMLNLPIGIVDWALKVGNKFIGMGAVDLNGVDLEELRRAITTGMRGKILDVTDEDSNEHVEIEIE